MIQANELRIGNWINVYGKFEKVESIGTYGVSFYTGFAKYTLPNLKPITLTEEILLKCGAKLQGIEYIIKASALPIKIRISYGIAYCGFGNVYLGDRIKFLHELQNLYQALTGQELKIEL